MRTALSIEKLRTIYVKISKTYDFQHALITARADQKGRKLLVKNSISKGNYVLDCGSGTGSTGIMAAKEVGANGKVMVFDLSVAMLTVAHKKVLKEGLQDRVNYQTGDMVHLPFDDDKFDVVLSTYSLCPLYDPEKGALELYRVTKPGGKIAMAHSSEPQNPILLRLANWVEDWAWHIPWLSMGCRSVNVLPMLINSGGKIIFSKNIGVPLWPFFVFIIEKPDPEK